MYNDYIDAGEMVFRKGWGVRYANMLTQSVVDYRRAIDYLAARNDIDSSRIGVVGYSMGGHMAFILGAVEERIQATVACVVPHREGMPMAPSAFARDMGTDPLLMLVGRKDRFYTVDQANALFDAVPGNAKKYSFSTVAILCRPNIPLKLRSGWRRIFSSGWREKRIEAVHRKYE